MWFVGGLYFILYVGLYFLFLKKTLLCNRKPVTLFLNTHFREWMRGRRLLGWRGCVSLGPMVYLQQLVTALEEGWMEKPLNGKDRHEMRKKVLIDCKETSAGAPTDETFDGYPLSACMGWSHGLEHRSLMKSPFDIQLWLFCVAWLCLTLSYPGLCCCAEHSTSQ